MFSVFYYTVLYYIESYSLLGFLFGQTERNKVTKKFSLSVGTKYDFHYTKIKTNCRTKKRR